MNSDSMKWNCRRRGKKIQEGYKEPNHELEYKQVMDSIDVLDILLDKVEAQSGEESESHDMYLAYYEYERFTDRIIYVLSGS